MGNKTEHLEEYIKSLAKSVDDLTARVELLEKEARKKQ